MHRREFVKLSTAGLALTAAGGYHVQAADDRPKRVGLIGCGWYGKCDLLRLIQVAPVEVLALCDVDTQDARRGRRAGRRSGRSSSKKPPHLRRLPQDAQPTTSSTSCWSARPTTGTR